MTRQTYVRGPGWAQRSGDTLTGEFSYARDGKKPKQRTWRPAQFDAPLAGWFAAASDGDRTEIYVDVDSDSQVIAVRLAHPPVFALPASDPGRIKSAGQLGGKPNPYTFIPAPPRTSLPPGLEDGQPAPHGIIDPGTQWSGWLVLRLVTTTPMLLPDPAAVTRDAAGHPTYPVRTGPDGRPFLHGASVKGALRSAYEAVTDSRYAVFRGHDRPLAYRRPASAEKGQIEAARVQADSNGSLRFQLCTTYRVPLYDPPGRHVRKAEATGQARQIVAASGWGELHGRRVACAIGGGKVARVALAGDELGFGGQDDTRVRGWLSVTGQSVRNKASERLFVPDAKNQSLIDIQNEHHRMWHAVLASYHDAAEQREPEAQPGPGLEFGRHVIREGKVPDRLEDGDLVYLERDRDGTVTAVLPVYIGRLPFQAAPAELLDESLHPAASLGQLSPADRLFGWAAPQARPGRAAASGYRGRLRITAVRCETEDWRTEFPPPGVTLAPLSTPKPTQFRFYAASDQDGTPMPPGVRKNEGYRLGSGLRGRKAYWYPSQTPGGYWQPGTSPVDGQFREWQAPDGVAPSQTSSHLGWVKENTEFTVRLFIDAVPGPELGPLIWLASQDGCPLRLGAAKPLGFGAVTVAIDWEATELRTGSQLLGCWTSLRRPEPCAASQVRALAQEFEHQAEASPALAPAIAAFRAVASGLPEPAAYPRTRTQPEAETYRWFVANEKIKQGRPDPGLALPHVLEQDQKLPFLTPGES